jgi:PPOX class probable F420-dependent enzyme
MMADITDFSGLVAADHGLVVVSTLRADTSVQSTVVNAGVLPHPVRDHEVVGFVVRGGARKLANLRERPRATVTVRAGWQWVTAEGPVELAGPADPLDGLGPDGLRRLLRDVFTAAGGEHDDWDTYDRVMAEEGRTAVLLTPDRVYSNP